jgi:tRNA(Arg) A34 adenosine deaminase TadA
MKHEFFLTKAIEKAMENIKNGGGPFGAVIVKEGEIIATCGNSVTIDNDPTAHAEVNCIREACKVLNTFDLSDCVIYSSCEPCPMCLSAIYWARIQHIYYAATRKDAALAGFDDQHIYDEIPLKEEDRSLPIEKLTHTLSALPFDKWRNKEDKTEY